MRFLRVLWDDRERVRLEMLISQACGAMSKSWRRWEDGESRIQGGSSAKTELVL